MSIEEINCELTFKRNGILYKQNSLEPFTGNVFSRNSDGNICSIAPYKNGILEGIKEHFDKDSELIKEVSYKNGKLDGVTKYSEHIKGIGPIRYTAYFSKGVVSSFEATYPHSDIIHWISTPTGDVEQNIPNNSSNIEEDWFMPIVENSEIQFFTKQGLFSYSEHHKDGMIFDENGKEKTDSALYFDIPVNFPVKSSIEEIITWTFLFMAIAYGIFRLVRLFVERDYFLITNIF